MAAKYFYGDVEAWPGSSDDDFINGGVNHHGVNAAAADGPNPKKQRDGWNLEGIFSSEEAKDWRFASSSIESIDPYNVVYLCPPPSPPPPTFDSILLQG